MNNAIEVRGLCKDYGDFRLEHVDLTVPGGTILGLIGENGAGKSTVIRCLLGLVRPDGGEISLLGRAPEEAKEDIGVVLDESSFHEVLRAPQVGKIFAGLYAAWDPALYEHYLAKFGLPRDKKIKEFSRGMKMKLGIAVALSHRPKLLLLDEATGGLDPVVRNEILDEFLDFIQEEDHAVLISSHITSDLEKAADYITYLHQGRVALSQPKDELLDRYGRVGCSAADLAAIQPGDLLRVRRGTFGCEGLTADREAFRRKYPGLTVDPATLEDIMLFIGKGESLCAD